MKKQMDSHPRLSLDHVILSSVEIEETPSKADGLAALDEMDYRIFHCMLLSLAGRILDVSVKAVATSQCLFQRYFYRHSFVREDALVVSMAAIFLAAKVEECPRQCKEVILAFKCLFNRLDHKNCMQKQTASGFLESSCAIVDSDLYLTTDSYYTEMKAQVLATESKLLTDLGFKVHQKHPHNYLGIYLKALGLEKNERLSQSAWNYMTDSFLTNAVLRFLPHKISCAAIYLAACHHGLAMPHNWGLAFDTTESELLELTRVLTLPQHLTTRTNRLNYLQYNRLITTITYHRTRLGLTGAFKHFAATLSNQVYDTPDSDERPLAKKIKTKYPDLQPPFKI